MVGEKGGGFPPPCAVLDNKGRKTNRDILYIYCNLYIHIRVPEVHRNFAKRDNCDAERGHKFRSFHFFLDYCISVQKFDFYWF